MLIKNLVEKYNDLYVNSGKGRKGLTIQWINTQIQKGKLGSIKIENKCDIDETEFVQFIITKNSKRGRPVKKQCKIIPYDFVNNSNIIDEIQCCFSPEIPIDEMFCA